MKIYRRSQPNRHFVRRSVRRRTNDAVRATKKACRVVEVINVDIAHAASLALGAEGRVRAMENEIKEKLPSFDVEHLTSLREVPAGTLHGRVAKGVRVDWPQ